MSDIEARAAQLHAEGVRKLEDAWDDDAGLVRYETPFGVLHDGRGSLAYAGALLREGAAAGVARAERIIRNVASMQERRPQDAHYGNFRWYFEDACVTDLNAVEFVLDALNQLIRIGGALSAEMRDVITEMIRLGLDEIDRLDVHPSYTNIALSDICNSVLGGEAIDEPAYVERGARRLDEWFEFTSRSGAPHEYNSPTYLAVDIARMAVLAEHTRDPRIALKARVAEERLWLHVAAHYHPGLAQLAGPHSRSYRDGWTGANGYLKLVLWKLLGDDALRRVTPYFVKGREEGFLGVADDAFHCPPYVLGWLRDKRFPYETLETADAANHNDLTTYMTGAYAMGTAAHSFTVGESPEPWPQPNSFLLHFARAAEPGYGVMYARYVINDKEAGASVHESNRNAEDFRDEGRFVGAQHRNRAIIAYGLMPRLRAAKSYKLSMRLLGGASDVWAGDRRVESFPAAIAPGEPLVVDAGGTYIALIALEPSDMGSDAPVELRIQDGELVLDVYNYLGPPKSFWEHRSQAGPFYKGNVRNAVIVEVAADGEFDGIDAFRRHVASASIADSVDEDYAREIVYASGGATLSLRYSLWDMSIVERKANGVPFVAPMGRAGAVDGRGPQWLQCRDALIEVGGVKLMAGRTPKWLFADDDAKRYVFVNPSDDAVPVWFETSDGVVECDEFAFGRIEVDWKAGTVAIESADGIGPVRLRASKHARLLINGVDVTERLRTSADAGMLEFDGA